jgi:hypothetical protein
MSSWSRRAAVAAAITLLAALFTRAAAQDAAAKGPAKPTKLFSSDSIFSITIATDLKKYTATKDSSAPWLSGKLIAGGDTLQIGLRPRGHFRRKSSTCSFPPVSVKFDKDVKGSTFAKQKKLKLVTTCWPGRAEYEEYIPEEYLLYRVYNLVTPFSFRARLVNVTYVDSAHADRPPVVTRAFFIEDQKDMAARNAGEPLTARNAVRDDFDAAPLAILSLFQFMIANTDWSFQAEHNIRLVRTGVFGAGVIPVAYDFDFSGVIATRYAVPDGSLPIRSVKNRIWMSYCYTPEELAPAIAAFQAQRPAITALYTNNPLLDPKTAAATLTYFDDFWSIIGDPKKLKKEISRHCAG